jgi:transcriptional regulator with XRE-family HTH domain
MALGKKIRELREELGMSQAQLASSAKLSQGYLSQLENDDVQNPSAAVIHRLSRVIHTDPRLLMQAAGYPEIGGGPGDANESFDVTVDPELLRFMAHLPREQQAHLLQLLQTLQRRKPAGATSR